MHRTHTHRTHKYTSHVQMHAQIHTRTNARTNTHTLKSFNPSDCKDEIACTNLLPKTYEVVDATQTTT